MAGDRGSEPRFSFSRHISVYSDSRATSTRLDLALSPDRETPFSPAADSRPPSRMSFFGDVVGHVHRNSRRRRRTTTETDYGDVLTLPRSYPARSTSPTRSNNPQPVGLVFQSPYNKDGKTFEIWNPELNLIERKIPELLSHVREVNFSCGVAKPYNPGRGSPVEVKYSFQSTNRSSFQDPASDSCPSFRDSLPTTRFGSSPTAAAVGIVPQVLPPLRKRWRQARSSRS